MNCELKRVLVTGGTGLVGSHLIVELIASGGYEIFATARSAKSVEKLRAVADYFGADLSGVNFVEVDLDDAAQVARAIAEVAPSVVMHTSAIVSLDGQNEQRMIESNVDMTRAVVDALLEQKKQRRDISLIHISSIAALGTRHAPQLTDEECRIERIADQSAYSRSKFFSENEVWRGIKMGLSAAIVNPSVIVGVTGDGTDRSGLQFIFEVIARGVPFYTGGVMGFVDVRDVARAMIRLDQTPSAMGQRYLLSGENLNYKQFIGDLGAAFSRRRPFIYASKWMLNVGVFFMGIWSKITRRPPMLARPMIGFMTDRAYYDGSKITRSVEGFSYTPFKDSAEMIAKRMVIK